MAESVMTAGRAAPESHFAYRPDIDGLRAIAVLAVVAYHAGIGGLPGGFTGVDIFFVISGFLIGGQIYRDVTAGTFRFRDFYARRMRRILPALFFLLLVMSAAGLALMTPAELREFGKEAMPAVLGFSNILFYLGGGYFGPASDYNSLLMTWSLGVEEQFYILLPLLLIALHRLRMKPLPALIFLSVLSFAGSLVLTQIEQKAAFYLLPTRAWELGVGAILAISIEIRGRQLLSGSVGEAASALGFLLILASIVTYAPTIDFPGVYALLPVVGTLLLIAAPGAAINRGPLSSSPASFVGKISYSWYLWHWPLFYYARILHDQGAPLLHPLLLIVGSFGAGILSWRYIERPFRHRVISASMVVLRYSAVALALAAAMIALYLSDGVPQRLNSEASRIAQAASQSRESPCLARYGDVSLSRLGRCVPPLQPGQQARVMVIGDSHASSIAPGFRTIAAGQQLGFGELTKSSCLPLRGFASRSPDRPEHRDQCIAFQDAAFDYIKMHEEIRTVILAGFWASGKSSVDTVETIGGGRAVSLAFALQQTVNYLQGLGRRVVLVQDAPSFSFDPYAYMVGNMIPLRRGIATTGAPQNETGFVSKPLADPARTILSDIAKSHPGTALVDPRAVLCARETCRFAGNAKLYYFDFQHLTFDGAKEAVPELPLQ